eukprot:tig00000451_g983.t1
MSVAVPLFTYAASVNHKGDHTIKETTLGNQATEAPYNATAVPFSEADLRLTVTNGPGTGAGTPRIR